MNIRPLLLALPLLTTGCKAEEDFWLDPIGGVYDAQIGTDYARVLIADSGDMTAYLPDSGVIYGGTVSSFDGWVDGVLQRYRPRAVTEFGSHAVADGDADFYGEFVEGDLIEATLDDRRAVRDASLWLDQDYTFIDGNVRNAAGLYTNTDRYTGDWTDLAISSTGRITGQDRAGCVFDGQAHDADLNVMPVDLRISCPGYSAYSAYGAMSTYRSSGQRALSLFASGASQAWAVELVEE